MKLLTEERRQYILNNINIGMDYEPGFIKFAKKLIEFCCFDFDYQIQSFLMGPGCVRLEFKEENNSLRVLCYNNYYELEGTSDSFHSGFLTDWKISKYFKENEIYLIINQIKMFYMGAPKDSVLFTGAFCPPHIGHRSLIERSINDGYDYAIIAVSNQSFLEKKFTKNNIESKYYYSEDARIKLVLGMTYDIPNVLIYGPERGYTYEVLCDVKKKYNLERLAFACGSDKLNEIHKWGFHDKLLDEYGFYILQRGEDDYNDIICKCNSLFSRYKIVKKAPVYADVSSTKIRDCMEKNADFGSLVNKKVAEILKNF